MPNQFKSNIISLSISDKEKNKFFRDYILWQQEGLDIDKHHCLFINFGVNMSLQYPQIRRVMMIFFLKFFIVSYTFKRYQAVT